MEIKRPCLAMRRNNIPASEVSANNYTDSGTEHIRFHVLHHGLYHRVSLENNVLEDRNEVTSQLKQYVQQLRSVLAPEPLLFGTPGSGTVHDIRRNDQIGIVIQ